MRPALPGPSNCTKNRKRPVAQKEDRMHKQNEKEFFQKKLIVLQYMGVQAPSNFTIKEKKIVTSGFLPEINVHNSEDD